MMAVSGESIDPSVQGNPPSERARTTEEESPGRAE